jgi:hypothetical protein
LNAGPLFFHRAPVFFGAAILGELNNKKSEGGEQDYVHHSAFVKKELQNKPNDEQQTSRNPEH